MQQSNKKKQFFVLGKKQKATCAGGFGKGFTI